MTAPGRRTILITGSTDGMGRWLALRLAEAGDRILVHGRDADRAEDVCRAVREATGEDRAEALLADLARLPEADRTASPRRAPTGRRTTPGPGESSGNCRRTS
ncbi:SDR family NAD(P)-dependent oxidoreductase [Streptomyces sp. NBC_01477]|uniref:SDR family NAD(P)-dependent oxidoreductase n=1 Tax=Streptomyces sp. NBC_01477 TaxID=2976015 RepID=UPI002E2F813D|nr:SDR family NAD(P)-dependent oxidoreductase [Streptomyces sp. NBC_01477]